MTETPDRYSMDNVEKHFDELLKGRDQLSVEECQVHTRDDADDDCGQHDLFGDGRFPI